mgnify:CR=1 FL=1
MQGAPYTAAQVDALLHHVADLVAVLDETGVITFASPGSTALLGHRPADLVGRNASDLLHPEDFELFDDWRERIEYVLELARALDALGVVDPHVHELAALLGEEA